MAAGAEEGTVVVATDDIDEDVGADEDEDEDDEGAESFLGWGVPTGGKAVGSNQSEFCDESFDQSLSSDPKDKKMKILLKLVAAK